MAAVLLAGFVILYIARDVLDIGFGDNGYEEGDW